MTNLYKEGEMMIITLNECKSLLQLTTNAKDSLIQELIPIVEQAIVDYCNDDFILRSFDYILSSAIKFNNSDNSIELSNIYLSKLVANDTIRVFKSMRNDGAYTIDSVSTDKLILNSINTLTDEDENESVYITKIKYPIPLKFIAAQMVNYNLEQINHGYIKETVDDHSWELAALTNGYPANLMSSLKTYRKLMRPTVLNSYVGW
jgi:hypothetical protein